jgi:transposase
VNVIMFDTSEAAQRSRGRAEIRNGVVRRRRWRTEEKGRIVAQAVAPGAVVAQVARQHDLTPQHLSNWIRAAKEGRLTLPAPEPSRECAEAVAVDFVPVVAMSTGEAARAQAASCIEIVVGSVLVRVPLGADARTLEAILRAVRRA